MLKKKRESAIALSLFLSAIKLRLMLFGRENQILEHIGQDRTQVLKVAILKAQAALLKRLVQKIAGLVLGQAT
jgi:hypothetical protein